MKAILVILSVLSLFTGKVVDQKGAAVAYATVYPEIAPEWGTATNNDGVFRFEANLPRDSRVIVSCIGYEKKTVQAGSLLFSDSVETAFPKIVLTEQPIALQETVVSAKKSKRKNKRKEMASLLYAVYRQIESDFPDENTRYHVVSDVKMQSEGSPWGMEQMIAQIVVLPESAQGGRDSVQFQGRFCKRFFDSRKRAQADTLLASETIERLEGKSKEKFIRRAANAVDSGVVVHRALFGLGNMRYDFEQAMTDTKHWSVSNESDDETVLTHTQTVSRYLGFFKMTFQRHYIVDSRTYAVRRFAEHAEVKVTIPFGIRLNADQLQMLNLLNMDEERIEKFRLKKVRTSVDLNTLYQRVDGHVYLLEKNMLMDAHILGSKQAEIPVLVKATQRVTDIQTEDVQPLSSSEITHRVKREAVTLY